jgi:hypothetical protein
LPVAAPNRGGSGNPAFAEEPAQETSEKLGSPGRIRTSDQPVNSRLLYR